MRKHPDWVLFLYSKIGGVNAKRNKCQFVKEFKAK